MGNNSNISQMIFFHFSLSFRSSSWIVSDRMKLFFTEGMSITLIFSITYSAFIAKLPVFNQLFLFQRPYIQK
jgi:hypothetical protein